MGYDLRITRAIQWTANTGQEIGIHEWLEVIRADPELLPDAEHGPLAVHYRSSWFDWAEGNVFTTDPDRATLAKMLALAHRLGGVVQGDDGEFYDSVHQWASRLLPEDGR